MENGNGQFAMQEFSGMGGFVLPPVASLPPAPEQPAVVVETPAKPKYDRSWMRTPEGRAKLSAAIRAGIKERKLRDARVAAQRDAKERTEENRTADIDKAIMYHMNAIKTLQAAKALLK